MPDRAPRKDHVRRRLGKAKEGTSAAIPMRAFLAPGAAHMLRRRNIRSRDRRRLRLRRRAGTLQTHRQADRQQNGKHE